MKLDFQQILDKFNDLDVKVRCGIFIALLVGFFIVDFFTLINLQSAMLNKTTAEIQKIKEDMERLKTDLQRTGQSRSALAKSKTELEDLNKKIRPLGDVSMLLDNISQVAREVGLKIEQVSPQGEPQGLFTSGKLKYYGMPIVVQTTAGYHEFGQFINKLESADLFFMTTHLSIEDQETDVKNHKINATLKFILSDTNIDKPEDPKAAKKKTGKSKK
jgi:Tfp pilus assembly protein PilO